MEASKKGEQGSGSKDEREEGERIIKNFIGDSPTKPLNANSVLVLHTSQFYLWFSGQPSMLLGHVSCNADIFGASDADDIIGKSLCKYGEISRKAVHLFFTLAPLLEG
ncbi:hypothetical protein NDU88_008940 [Pleurodeles waltl]|uniref:Uncharacterized protein n=1 Tax=Pleurodeles waltl TaxID=8319 RepID=A0AAV7QT98_PLEWA|nr:hypothetical protein NDU88_008940 [Pleurodeles waltl]